MNGMETQSAFLEIKYSIESSGEQISEAAECSIRHSCLGVLAAHWGAKNNYEKTAGRNPLKRGLLFFLRIFVYFHLFYILTTSVVLLTYRSINPAATTLMLYRKIDSGWKITAPRYEALEKIPKRTRNMAIKVEDGNFFIHHGIMLSAIKYAYEMNKNVGRPTYGGSTITMQTARTLFLVPEKSYLRKYLELIVTVEMEVILDKNRILELYFNYAEWGRGIFGIEAASRFHYKQGIRAIGIDQSARLITLLSSPIKYGPYTFNRNGILRSRYNYLVSRFM